MLHDECQTALKCDDITSWCWGIGQRTGSLGMRMCALFLKRITRTTVLTQKSPYTLNPHFQIPLPQKSRRQQFYIIQQSVSILVDNSEVLFRI